MSVETWPVGVYPTSASFRLVRNVARFEGPFNAGGQVSERVGLLAWRADLSFTNLGRRAAGELDALMSRARGGAVPILVPNFRRARRSADIAALSAIGLDDEAANIGRPFVDTLAFFTDTGNGWSIGPAVFAADDAAQGATSVTLGGMVPGARAFDAGDCFSIGNHLYQVDASGGVTVNGVGKAVCPIAPGLRAAVTAGAVVKMTRPVCRMTLAVSNVDNPTVKPAFSSYELSFAETLS